MLSISYFVPRPSYFLLRLVTAAILIAGCGDRPEDTASRSDTSGATAISPPRDTTTPGPPKPTDTTMVSGRPLVKTDTIHIEGDAHVMKLRLIGEGLPFSTYIPENEIRVDPVSSGEGIGVRFIANFGGRPNEEAFLHIFLPAESYTLEQMKELVSGAKGLARSNGWRLEEPAASPCPWAEVAYLLRDTVKIPALGHICIGRHAGRPFYATVHYPAEYAEGFVPRIAKILEELRWSDDGAGLGE